MNASPHSSVYETLAATAGRWPDRDVLQVLPSTAAVYGIEAGSISYGDMKAQVDELSARLQRAGYRRGMRVATLLENRPEFFILWLALNRLGASIVPINPDLRAGELEYLIENAEPALIICIPERASELQACVKAVSLELSVQSLDQPLTHPRIDAVVAADFATPEREAAVLYTSGTTGRPKGCVLSNNYFLLAGDWYRDVGGLASLSEEGECMITPLPVFHMNAMAYSFMAMLTVGGSLCVLDRFHPSSWWSDVRASEASCLHYLGVMPTLLMNAPPAKNDRQHSIRFGFGAGVDPDLHEDFESRFGFPMVEAWAMTETGAGAVVAASTPERRIGCSCLGTPADNIEYRLTDEQGADVSVGEPGELWVRRAGADPRLGFFTEYYRDPQATAEAWEHGWFHTGDVVRKDESGNLYFVDRRKNVIRRSGENIAAVEVESILKRHEAVDAVGVTAVSDTIRGDEVFAFVVTAEPSAQLANELAQWALQQMAYYKVPGYFAFVPALPLTATQKVQRAELKKQAEHRVLDTETIDTRAYKRRNVATATVTSPGQSTYQGIP